MDMEEKIKQSLKVLELTDNCSMKDIETAFRLLVLKYHPDVCKEKNKIKCHERFMEINNARIFLRLYYTGGFGASGQENVKKTEYEEYMEYMNRYFSDVF